MKNNRSNLSRREFLQNTAKLAMAVTAAGLATSYPAIAGETPQTGMMRRKLGKTGMEVSILTFGGGSQFLMNPDGEWEKILETAVESGINLFDTAPSYSGSEFNQGGGKSLDSEERYGEILPKYRNRIYISTKVEERDPDKARAGLEASLKKMKTDHVDILFIHAIVPGDDTASLEKGLYKTMMGLKSEGLTRNVAFSSMDSAERSKELLEKLDFDVALLAINAANYGDFKGIALPAARKKNTGIIAMKVMRDLVGKNASPKELLEHAWTLPGISGILVGHKGLEPLQENIRLAKEFSKTGTSQIDQEDLEMRMASLAGPHALCWARPDYRDGIWPV